MHLQLFPTTRTLRFLILCSCAYLDSLGKFGFRAYIGLQKQMSVSGRVRAEFDLQNEAHL